MTTQTDTRPAARNAITYSYCIKKTDSRDVLAVVDTPAQVIRMLKSLYAPDYTVEIWDNERQLVSTDGRDWFGENNDN